MKRGKYKTWQQKARELVDKGYRIDSNYYKLYYYRGEAYLLLLADIKKGMFDDNSYTPNIQYL